MCSSKKNGNSTLQTMASGVIAGTSLVILFAVYTEHPTNTFVPIVIFYHAGGVQFYCFQLFFFFLRYNAGILSLIHLNYFFKRCQSHTRVQQSTFLLGHRCLIRINEKQRNSRIRKKEPLDYAS